MTDTTITAYLSTCVACDGPITTAGATAATGWRHEHAYLDTIHPAVPETRASIDADCAACGYPTMGYSLAHGTYHCSKCRYSSGARHPGNGLEATADAVAAVLRARPEPLIQYAVTYLAHLGARLQWSTDDNRATTEALVTVAGNYPGLPPAGDQLVEDSDYWHTVQG